MSNITALNLESVSLAEFNRLRHPKSPIPERTLRHMAQNNNLPGAIRLGGRYRVILAVYDQAIKHQLEAPNDLESLADKIEAAIRGSA